MFKMVYDDMSRCYCNNVNMLPAYAPVGSEWMAAGARTAAFTRSDVWRLGIVTWIEVFVYYSVSIVCRLMIPDFSLFYWLFEYIWIQPHACVM